MSSATDKINSSIIANSTISNWSVYDTSVDLNTKILQSQNVDGTTYKYAGIYYSANAIYVTGYEAWNATTHVAINQAVCKNSQLCTPLAISIVVTSGNTTAAGSAYIWVTPRTLCINGAFVGEFTRSSKAINSTYPCIVVSALNSVASIFAAGLVGGGSTWTPTNSAGICRYRAPSTGADVCVSIVLNQSLVELYPYGRCGSAIPVHKVLRTPNDMEFLQALPVLVKVASGTLNTGVLMGKLFDLLCLYVSGITINVLDEIFIDGATYVCCASNNGAFLLLPKV